MRSSNPVFSTLTKDTPQGGSGYLRAQNAPGYGAGPQHGYQSQTMGYGASQQAAYNMGAQQTYGAPSMPQEMGSGRALTVDDVISKTAITLGVIVVFAVVNFMLTVSNPGVGLMLTGVGAIGGLIAVLVSTFGRKFGSKVVTLIYAAFEGLFVGGLSFMFTSTTVGTTNAGAMILQAVLGTFGVFAGMLYAYKSGAIKVTSKTRRVITGALVGVLVLAIGNMLLGMFTGNHPLTNGGPLAIVFSLVCIGLAAMSFLTDFDSADRLVRAGAPAEYAWGIALGLAVTLVWLYTEILRLLSYFRD